MTQRTLLLLPALLVLAACGKDPSTMLGTIEWDRVEVLAEAPERLLAVHVAEGQQVEAGQLLAEQDASLLEAERLAAAAEVDLARGRLDELVSGPRRERIAAARARLAQARSQASEAQREFARVDALVAQGLLPAADRDRVLAARDGAGAAVDAASAELAELTAGTRAESIRQAEAQLAAAEARLALLDRRIARLRIHAPRAGRVEALPFEAGDQPRTGAAVVVLQVGEAPHARIYVPQSLRAGLAPGSALQVRGPDEGRGFPGRLRWVAAEPSFTPYFALAGDDVSRLVYLAEVALGPEAAALPAGLPVSATPSDGDDD